MADYIKGLILEIANDFMKDWWGLLIPVAALVLIKYVKIPARARIPVLLLICTLGGYLIGMRKPPEIRTVVNTVDRRVEVPVERVVEKRVEVPTIVEKIKEVFVQQPLNPYGKCIFCSHSFHMDGATGMVKCPKCGKAQKAKSTSDMEQVAAETKQSDMEYLKQGMMKVVNETEALWRLQPTKYDSKCPGCGFLFRFPKGSDRAFCPRYHEVVGRDESALAWQKYRAGGSIISQVRDMSAVPYTAEGIAHEKARVKVKEEDYTKRLNEGILKCPGCKWTLVFEPYSDSAYCRVCKKTINRASATFPQLAAPR